MVWGVLSNRGKSHICLLLEKQNTKKYCATLTDYMVPFVYALHDENYYFQHDRATMYTANWTTTFL